ncbi:PPC domain-containing protein [Brevundimonas sp. GCM10030266]|uniref:PPC domain-containing protein n=1 Tax=Brevundimonas sp. GCM10030266 TaxID=3273386 RepID=UPI00360D3FC3
MRRKTILAAVSSLAIAAALAGPAFAQEPTPLAPGDQIEGEIAEGDATAPDDAYRYDSFAITAVAGQRFEVVMRSEAFDSYLQVQKQGEDENGEPLASDDDGLGEGLNSRLRFTAPTDGVYVVRARPISGLDGGAYSLSLTERGPAEPEPAPQAITLGQTVEGEIGDDSPENDEGVAYQAWTFSGRSGDRVSIALDAEDFDPLVRLGRTVNGVFSELAYNDDGPDSGLNSRLVFTLTETGDYVIRATPLSAGGKGGYSLTLSEGPPPVEARDIRIGQEVRGELTETDGRSANGGYADAYRFSGREGQRVRIDMTSSAFDTYIELFDDEQTSLATDDDGGPEGTNSRLVFTLPKTGSYVIEARAFSQSTGAYRLNLTEVEPEKPPQSLAFGATLQGEIDENDSRDDDDRGFDAFVFEGREGQRIRAIMRSGDFDTYLQIGNAEGDFSALASDDDGLGEGTDSRLSFTLPSDGRYVLRASPLGSDGEGLYSLELQDRGPQPQPGSLLVGSTARGVLTETDATADDNSFYDAYRVTLKEDEKLVIKMVSNEVDSFIIIGRPTESGGFEGLGSDDDGLSDTHSKLEWTAPEDGTFEIRAGTFQQGQTGAYALIVEKQP